jgi:hypothetical protein
MVFMRPANLARFSLNFALNPVAAGVPEVSDDCWAVAGNEKAPTARQSRPILITLICFLSLHLFLVMLRRRISKVVVGNRISIVQGAAKSNIHDGGGLG